MGPRIPLALPDCSSAELFEFIQSDFGRIYPRGNHNDIHILLNDECDPAQWKPMLKPCHIEAKSFRKSTPKPCKIEAQAFRNLHKTMQNRSLEGVWAPVAVKVSSQADLGRILGASWGVLGGVFGRPGCIFGVYCGRLGMPTRIIDALWAIVCGSLRHRKAFERKVWI